MAGNELIPSSPYTVADWPVETSIRVSSTPSSGSPLLLSNTMPQGSTRAVAVAVSVLSALSAYWAVTVCSAATVSTPSKAVAVPEPELWI